MNKNVLILMLFIFCAQHLNAQLLSLAGYPKIIREGVKEDFSESDIDTLKLLAFKNDNNDVRYRACRLLVVALNKSKNIRSEDITELLARYNVENEKNIKSEILNCLWAISYKDKDERILDVAVSIVQAGGGDIARALNIISNFGGDDKITKELLKIIKEDPFTIDVEIVRSAALILGKMKNKEAIPILIEKILFLLRNTDREYYKKPTNDFCEGLPPIKVGDDLVGIYSSGLSMGGEEVINALKPFLSDDNAKVKYHAAKMLGHFGDTTVVPILCEFLWVSKIPGERLYIVKTLESLGDKRAIPTLKRALVEKDNNLLIDQEYTSYIRHTAYRALQKLGVKVVCKGNDKYEVEE